MRVHRPIPRTLVAAAILAVVVVGVAIDVTRDDAREWLYLHPFTSSVLVGILLISATYLVVERALEERERQRWSDAARPLLAAIAIAAAETDRELRASGPAAQSNAAWLAQLLERYQAVLTGTPELIARWHAALSLAQHAGAALAARPSPPDAEYEAAWDRFRSVFADVHDFSQMPVGSGATWRLPAVGTAPHQRT